LFWGIYHVIHGIAQSVDSVLANKDNCRFLAVRCVGMRAVVEDIERHFVASKANVDTLSLLAEEFQRTQELLQRYSEASWLRRFVSAHSLREDFETQDRRLTALVGDLCASLHLRSHATLLGQHAPYVEARMEDIGRELDQLRGQLSEDIRELRASLARGGAAGDELSGAEVKALLRCCVAENRVGRGTFGSVYRARFRGLEVAVKAIDFGHEAADDRRIADDFRREVRLPARGPSLCACVAHCLCLSLSLSLRSKCCA
jgi:hypothetical protein